MKLSAANKPEAIVLVTFLVSLALAVIDRDLAEAFLQVPVIAVSGYFGFINQGAKE